MNSLTDDFPPAVTLQGLTRLPELACTLNPLPPPVQEQSVDLKYEEMMESLFRVYGEEARIRVREPEPAMAQFASQNQEIETPTQNISK